MIARLRALTRECGRRLPPQQIPDFVCDLEIFPCRDHEHANWRTRCADLRIRTRRCGWVPVALAWGDSGPRCHFQPIVAGVAITGADLAHVHDVGMARICKLLEGKGDDH